MITPALGTLALRADAVGALVLLGGCGRATGAADLRPFELMNIPNCRLLLNLSADQHWPG